MGNCVPCQRIPAPGTNRVEWWSGWARDRTRDGFGRRSALRGLPVRRLRDLVPLLPGGDAPRVLVLDDLERSGAEEDAQRRLVRVDHLQDGRPGCFRIATGTADGAEDLRQPRTDAVVERHPRR